jgi:hypothetical protein
MAARNAERFIEAALRSALDQTVPPVRIVVVDDGSTDGTADLAARLDDRVTVHREPHRGLGPSRNVALREVTSPLVAFLDADDLWLPTLLERLTEPLEADHDLDVAYCLVDEFLDGVEVGDPGIRAPRTGQAVPLSGNTLVRRSLIDRLGPFGSAPVGDWVRWWSGARAAEVREHVVREPLFRRRIHGGNNSLRREPGSEVFLDVARAHLRDLRARRDAGPEVEG